MRLIYSEQTYFEKVQDIFRRKKLASRVDSQRQPDQHKRGIKKKRGIKWLLTPWLFGLL